MAAAPHRRINRPDGPDERAAQAAMQWRSLVARARDSIPLLADKPTENGESTLRALWHCATGLRLSNDAAQSIELRPLLAEQFKLLEQLLEHRIAGIPLAHLTERQQFMGLEMIAGPAALIPRQETELLVRTALDALGNAVFSSDSGAASEFDRPLVMDICTGSGNVAAALAHLNAGLVVHACDLSADAIALAQRNLAHLGLSDRVHLYVGDLFEPLRQAGLRRQATVVTCNPPYVSSARVAKMAQEIAGHEPALAFDGGPFGVGILRRVIRDAADMLRPGGWLVLEVGLGQGDSVLRNLRANLAFTDCTAIDNTLGQTRVVRARRITD
jgi:release factor glutamine methyltransferase